MTLKSILGGLKETVSLICKDLQKIRERITAVEGRVSDLEDQMPPFTRNARMAAQQVIQANNRADDIKNHLKHNNVHIAVLPERVEGRDPTVFVEKWLQEIFGKESFTPVCGIAGTLYTTPPVLYPTKLHASQTVKL